MRGLNAAARGLLFWATAVAAVENTTSILFQGGTVIAFDEATGLLDVLRNASLLITGDTIASISTEPISNASLPANVEVIDAQGKILSPGFIDTHHHYWQTAFRTIGSNTTLGEYFVKYGEYGPAKTAFTPEDVYLGQLFAIYESLNAGVTSALDHAHHTFTRAHSRAGLQASVDSGARVWWSYAIHDIGTDFTVDQQMQDLASLAADASLNGANGGLVQVGLAYDGLSMGLSDAAVEQAVNAFDLAKSLNLSVITSHYVGEPWIADGTITTMNQLGLLNTSIPIVFSHATALTQSEQHLLRQFNHYISITPESEAHYGHLHPHSYQIQDQASLGIDTHFTFSGDILTQARLWLQEVRYKLFARALHHWEGVPSTNPMSAQQAFLLATRNGALALQRGDLGVLRAGARADVVVFDGSSPNMLGFDDPVAAVVLHANVGDIEHVLVGGRFRKRDRALVDADFARLTHRFLRSATRIQREWAAMDFPPLVGEWPSFPGFDYAATEITDVKRGDGNGY